MVLVGCAAYHVPGRNKYRSKCMIAQWMGCVSFSLDALGLFEHCRQLREVYCPSSFVTHNSRP